MNDLSPEQQLQPLFELFEHACVEVFESLGCQVVKVDVFDPPESAPSAYIDAVSEELKMVLMLRGPVDLIEETFPVEHEAKKITQNEIDDWIGELANRFMGHLKNKLLVYEHCLKIGVPVSPLDKYSSDQVKQAHVSRKVYFSSGQSVVECSLHVQMLVDWVTFIYHDPYRYGSGNDGDLEML